MSLSATPTTARRLPIARIILGALVLAGGLLTALAATSADRHTATAPEASAVSGSMAAPRVAIAGVLSADLTRPPSGYVQVIDTRRGPTVVIDTSTELANPHIVRGPDPNRLFVLAADLSAIDTTTGTTIWHTPASAPGVTMGGFTPPLLAVSADGNLLFLHSQQSPTEMSTPDELTAWIDVLALPASGSDAAYRSLLSAGALFTLLRETGLARR